MYARHDKWIEDVRTAVGEQGVVQFTLTIALGVSLAIVLLPLSIGVHIFRWCLRDSAQAFDDLMDVLGDDASPGGRGQPPHRLNPDPPEA